MRYHISYYITLPKWLRYVIRRYFIWIAPVAKGINTDTIAGIGMIDLYRWKIIQ